ncbi:VOC family protein [Abyssalbus ytuae]|uniref:VOC family protein n=1 Tax=Abyssalbus ytuae TaxID=2926907 RepID=A0A9E7CTK4_9FLAO|nr:VOC family protein [Abyssalbus ytuae]UOB16332.1 VOC family protein [Abyssalbus ytuae]
MKDNILGLRTTIYKVPDLNEAKEWYSKVFKIEPYFDEPFYVGFNIEGYELGLIPEDIPADKKTDNVLSYWGVENIEKEYNRIISLGGIESEKVKNVGGEIVIATLKDPWGNTIGLIYNPGFKNE